MKSTKKLFQVLIFVMAFLFVAAPLNTEAASIKLSKKSTSVYVGKSTTLKVKGTKKKAKWSSSNKKIATVNSKGKVTGKKAGKATITAKIGKKKYTCKVTVKSILSVAKTKLTLKKNTNLKVTYKGNDYVYFKVKDTNIVTCKWTKKWKNNTTNLTFIPKNPGTTTVLIYNDTNKEKYTIKVTVPGPWDGVKVILPETLGEQAYPMNRIKINSYEFYSAGYSSADYYNMRINFTCVQNDRPGKSNWGEYFYCYDKNGNVIDDVFLYCGSLSLGYTYNDTVTIPKNTATIEFFEYPDPNKKPAQDDSNDNTNDDTSDDDTSTSDPTLWTYSEASEVYNHTKDADDYLSKANNYMVKACDNKMLEKAYMQYAYDYVGKAKAELNDALIIAQENREVTTTDGSTLEAKIIKAIEACDKALLVDYTNTNELMTLYSAVVSAGIANLGPYKIATDMLSAF